MSSLIVAAILVGITVIICFLLVWIHNKEKRKKMDKLFERFRASAVENKISFSSQELLTDSILGLDGVGRKILILNKDQNGELEDVVINLDEIKNCSVRKVYGSIRVGELKKRKLNEYLDKIVLHFEFANSKPPVEVCFYKHVDHSIYHLAELEQKARHWELVINKMLKTKSEKIA